MLRIMLVCLLFAVLFGCSSKEERRDELIESARKYEEKARYAEARVEARNAIKLDPEHVDAYLVIGRCCLKEQDHNGAYASFLRAHELDAHNIEALRNLGQLLLLSGNTAKAEEYIALARADAPDDTGIRLLESSLLLRKGLTAEARNVLETLLRQEPDNYEAMLAMSGVWMQEGRPDEAEKLLREALKRSKDTAPVLQALANIALKRSD